MGADFSSETGNGVKIASYRLAQALKLYSSLDIYTVSVDEFMPWWKLPFPTLNKAVKRALYFEFAGSRPKNVHVMNMGIIPLNKLKNYKHKIITLHDLHSLDKDYIKNKIKSGNVFQRPLTRIKLTDRQKYWDHIKDYDFVVPVNDKIKQILIEQKDVPQSKIATLNDIIPDKFQPLNTPKNNGSTIIGYINNTAPNKTEKLMVFIEKFKKIKDDSLKFQIYGSGFPFLDFIKDDPRIKYLGFLSEENIVETYNSFDVFLSTSKTEGFGMPIAQAKACKVPVLCYDGDIPPLIKNNTLLWNDDNIEELITKRAWKNVNLEKAYMDIAPARPKNVALKLTEIYKNIFE